MGGSPGSPEISLRYASKQAYAGDYQRSLSRSSLFVRVAGLGKARTPVLVKLTLPSGDELELMGEVVAPTPTGAGLALFLSRDEKARLAEEAL